MLLAVAAGIAACGGETTAPLPAPNVYNTARFRIVDSTDAPADLIDTIGVHLETVLDQVLAFLPEFSAPSDTVTFFLRPGKGLPYVTPAASQMVQWRDDLALEYLPHQFVHMVSGYQRSDFLEEGIAVYTTEVLEPDNTIVYPYRGQPPHAWVSLFESYQSTIPLSTAFSAVGLAFDYTGSSPDASAWQLFIEAGSFTKWVFDVYGRDVWFRLFDLQNLGVALGASTADIEAEWLAAARDQYPDPLPCEDALATRGPLTDRELFWCARARGG